MAENILSEEIKDILFAPPNFIIKWGGTITGLLLAILFLLTYLEGYTVLIETNIRTAIRGTAIQYIVKVPANNKAWAQKGKKISLIVWDAGNNRDTVAGTITAVIPGAATNDLELVLTVHPSLPGNNNKVTIIINGVSLLNKLLYSH